MPFYKAFLSGRNLPLKGARDHSVCGFYIGRHIEADNEASAKQVLIENVLSELAGKPDIEPQKLLQTIIEVEEIEIVEEAEIEDKMGFVFFDENEPE